MGSYNVTDISPCYRQIFKIARCRGVSISVYYLVVRYCAARAFVIIAVDRRAQPRLRVIRKLRSVFVNVRCRIVGIIPDKLARQIIFVYRRLAVSEISDIIKTAARLIRLVLNFSFYLRTCRKKITASAGIHLSMWKKFAIKKQLY